MGQEGGNSGHRASRPEGDLPAHLGVASSQKECHERTASQNDGDINSFPCERIFTSIGTCLKTSCIHFLWLWNKLGQT